MRVRAEAEHEQERVGHRRAPRWPWKISINRGHSVGGAMLSVRSDPMLVMIGRMSLKALTLRPKRFSKQAMHRLSFQPRPNFFPQSLGVAMYQLPVRSTSTPQSFHSGLFFFITAISSNSLSPVGRSIA